MQLLKTLLFFVLLTSFISNFGQVEKNSQSGNFSLGVRSSMGLVYEKDWGKMSFGNGGQIRLRLSDKVNTEWFADFLQGDMKDFAKRTDVHIGWSAMYYPLNNTSSFQPYIMAGHCFEFLKIEENALPENHIHRRSASVQAGIGTHWHLTNKLDFSVSTQYMMHFGTNIKIDSTTSPISFSKDNGVSLQDHILINFNLNYTLADLW